MLKHKVGDKVTIVTGLDNNSLHRFKIGEEVTIMEIVPNNKCDYYKAVNSEGKEWCIIDEDIKD